MLSYNKTFKSLSRDLRSNMSKAEKYLWSKIRRKQLKGYQFYRQKIIHDYIVDFFCPKAKLVIELDGGQHYEYDGLIKDRIRDNYLSRIGIRILRFTNIEVLKDINMVVGVIWRNLE